MRKALTQPVRNVEDGGLGPPQMTTTSTGSLSEKYTGGDNEGLQTMTTAEGIEAVRVARRELDRLTALLSGGLPNATVPHSAAAGTAALQS